MKNISASQFASIKRIYMNVSPLIIKKNKLISKINELTVEIAQIKDEITENEMGIKALTGGYSSEQLIIRTVEDTGKIDKNGKFHFYRESSGFFRFLTRNCSIRYCPVLREKSRSAVWKFSASAFQTALLKMQQNMLLHLMIELMLKL